jgi:hypothetical protein
MNMTPEETQYVEDLERTNEQLSERCEQLQKEVDYMRPIVRALSKPSDDYFEISSKKSVAERKKTDHEIMIEMFKKLQKDPNAKRLR